LSCATTVAHRAARQLRTAIPLVVALLVALGATVTVSQPASAAGYAPRVVIVVGPTHGSTAKYLERARDYARQARAYGAEVAEIYTPNATWARVVSASQGANIFIYLGHGNGYPSPYGAFNRLTKDGLGLNSYDGSTSHKYYGEYYVDRYLNFAPNAVVILNRLCYASGNSEPGKTLPTKATAIKRVDNYAAGFLRTGARAVFAEGIGSASFILYSLFKTNRTIRQTFWADPTRSGARDFTFASVRTPGKTAIMDPFSGSRYYRSVVGDLSMTAGTWR
jgi:hypothetical protein